MRSLLEPCLVALLVLSGPLLAAEGVAPSLEDLAQRVEEEPDDPLALAEYGFALLGGDRESEGLELLAQADVLGYDEPRVQIILARAHMKTENWSDASLVASRVSNSALAGPQDKVEAAFIGGSARWRLGDVQSAEELFGRALRMDPTHGPSMVNLGLLYYSTSRHSQGIAALKKAADIDPENPRVAVRVAGAFEGMGRYDLALPLRERVVDLLPESVGARKVLVQDYLMLKKREETLPHLAFLAEAEPDFGLHRVMQAQVLISLGRFEEALAHAEAALALGEAAQPLIDQARSGLEETP